jgi:hypothetical protein
MNELEMIRERSTARDVSILCHVSRNTARAWMSGKTKMPKRFQLVMMQRYGLASAKVAPLRFNPDGTVADEPGYGDRYFFGTRRDGNLAFGRQVFSADDYVKRNKLLGLT